MTYWIALHGQYPHPTRVYPIPNGLTGPSFFCSRLTTAIGCTQVADIRKPTPSSKKRRCLLIFNDVVFFCKARKNGYECREVLSTESLTAHTQPYPPHYPHTIRIDNCHTNEVCATVACYQNFHRIRLLPTGPFTKDCG